MNKNNLQFEKKVSTLHKRNKERSEISQILNEAQNYFDKNQYEQANYLYQRVMVIEPENIIALNSLGLIAMKIGMLNLAIELLGAACELRPNNIIINSNLALVYDKASQFDEAMMQYIYVLEIDENSSSAHGELARLNLQVGNHNIALSHYLHAFELNPNEPEYLQGIVDLNVSLLSDNDLIKVENFLKEENIPLSVRSRFYFLLGDIYHKSSRYEEAFANYIVANISKVVKFSAEEHTDYISNILLRYQTQLFSDLENRQLNKSKVPVFIVGMPCSGISIIEDMLTTSIDINSAGDVSGIEWISENQELLTLEHVSDETMNKYSNYYMNEIKNILSIQGNDRSEKILNTLPENYLHLGLITLLFPNAYIIHCRRNPLDTCLSNYFTDFPVNKSYSYNQENIAKYYIQYERLMTHWKKVLPISIHTVEYEALINDPVEINKEICQFIDIDWKSTCLDSLLSKIKAKKSVIANNQNSWNKFTLEPSRVYSPFIDEIESVLEQSDIINSK